MKTIAVGVSLVGLLASACAVPQELPPGGGSGSTAGEDGSGGSDGSISDGGGVTMTTTGADESTSSASGMPGTEDSGDPEVPCEGTCTASAFAGWEGPVIVRYPGADQTLPACDGDFGTVTRDGFTSVAATPATCACSCGDAAGSSCGDGVTVGRYTANCAASQGSYVVGDTCTNIPDTFSNQYWRIETPTPDGGACPPSLEMDREEPVFGDAIRLCQPSVPTEGSCADGLCVPQPSADDGPMCFWREGDEPCPAGDRTLIYDGSYEDQRECSACECSTPSGACVYDAPLGATYTTNSCDQVDTLLQPDVCTLVPHAVSALIVSGTHPEVSCSPSGGEPVGEVVPAHVVTMCCVE